MRRFTYGLFLAGALATTGCDQTTVSPAAALVTGQHDITAIAADGSFIYWSTSQGAVMRVSIDGGKPETVVPAQAGFVGPTSGNATLKVDASNVYWTTNAAVVSAPKTGGASLVLAGVETPLSDLTGLDVDDASEFVYFTHRAGFVRKAPKVPGAMVTLASAESSPSSPVVRGATLYWAAAAETGAGTARVMDVGGGSPATVTGSEFMSPASFAGISVDDRNVYWTAGGTVSWVSIAGGTPSVIQSSGDFVLAAILGDETNVYWSGLSGDVSTAPLTPNAIPQPVVSGPAGRVSLAADLTSLYWANQADGSVVSMPKLAITGVP
jgi:hypothetical protein